MVGSSGEVPSGAGEIDRKFWEFKSEPPGKASQSGFCGNLKLLTAVVVESCAYVEEVKWGNVDAWDYVAQEFVAKSLEATISGGREGKSFEMLYVEEELDGGVSEFLCKSELDEKG